MIKLLKKYMIWVVLLLTVGACLLVSRQDNTVEEDIALPNITKERQTRIAASNPKIQIEAPQRRVLFRQEVVDMPLNIFTPYAPPHEAEEEVIPPEEQMPSNPFTYAGKLFDKEGLVVFLTDGRHNHTVKAGEIINDNWRIKSINPPELILEYMPLGLVTTIQIGAAN